MAKNRLVDTVFWEDNYTANLDPIEKLLFLYFLTNTSTNICGIYQITLKKVAVETGIDKEMVERVLGRFERDGKIFYREGWLGIKNFIRHQNQKSPLVLKGIERELENVPDFIKLLVKIEGMDTLSHLTQPNLTKHNAIAGDEFDSIDAELAGLLREKISENMPTFKGPNMSQWAKQVRLMRERDGRTPEQIRYLIIWSQADPFWQANILSTKKLREKFDTLVAQVKRKVNTETLKKSNVAFV